MSFLQDEVFPEHLRFLRTTEEHVDILTSLLGDTRTIYLLSGFQSGYIEVDLDKLDWRLCMSYEFLYRTQPPIIDIVELCNEIKKRKRNINLDDILEG